MNIIKRLAKIAFIGVIILVIALAIHKQFPDTDKDILERDIYTMTDEEYREYCEAYVEKYHILPGSRVESWINYDKILKKTLSDIDGLSQYDKVKMGLNEENGSDTDGDGLTDKEEIEVYGSDPLKTSTAGDLYFDSYKVEHNMDLHTYYEYEGEFEYEHKEYFDNDESVNLLSLQDTICFYPTAPESKDVRVSSNGEIVPENFEIYQEYEIWNFAGNITINSTTIDSLVNLSDYDIVVYDSYDDVAFYCGYQIDKQKFISLDLDFIYSHDYFVIIGKSNDSLKFFKKIFKISLNYHRDFSRVTNEEFISSAGFNSEQYFVCGSPLLTLLEVSIYPKDI